MLLTAAAMIVIGTGLLVTGLLMRGRTSGGTSGVPTRHARLLIAIVGCLHVAVLLAIALATEDPVSRIVAGGGTVAQVVAMVVFGRTASIRLARLPDR